MDERQKTIFWQLITYKLHSKNTTESDTPVCLTVDAHVGKRVHHVRFLISF